MWIEKVNSQIVDMWRIILSYQIRSVAFDTEKLATLKWKENYCSNTVVVVVVVETLLMSDTLSCWLIVRRSYPLFISRNCLCDRWTSDPLRWCRVFFRLRLQTEKSVRANYNTVFFRLSYCCPKSSFPLGSEQTSERK